MRPALLDLAAIAALVMIGAMIIERGRQRDIGAPDAAVVIAAAPSCDDMLENRRFVMRRMMIADGSLPLGVSWRNDALLGSCPGN